MTTELLWSKLSAWYGNQQVLFGIDLALPRQGCSVILGPCGTGKSSVLKSLHSLAHCSHSHVSDGSWHAQAAVSPDAEAQPCSLVGQKSIRPTGTVQHYLSDGMEWPATDLLSVLSQCVGERLKNELKEWLPKSITTCTKAEWALLRIVRATLHTPALLLLDEPTAGLDEPAAWAVRALIQELSATRCVVLVTHHQGEAQQLAQHVVLMLSGRIVEASPAKQFFQAPSTDESRHFLQFGTLAEQAREAPLPSVSSKLDALWAAVLAASQAQHRPRQAPMPPSLAECWYWVLPGHLAGMSQTWPQALHNASQSLQTIDLLLLFTNAQTDKLLANESGIHIQTYPVGHINGSDAQQPITAMAQGLDWCLVLDAQLQQGTRVLVVSDTAPSIAATALAMYCIWHGRGQCSVHSAIAVMQRLAVDWCPTQAQQRLLAHFFEFIVNDVAFTD